MPQPLFHRNLITESLHGTVTKFLGLRIQETGSAYLISKAVKCRQSIVTDKITIFVVETFM